MENILRFLLIVIIPFQLFSQHKILTNERSEKFINAVLNNNDSLDFFVLPEELALSKRLGITYEGVKNKFLISYEIPAQIIEEIKEGNTKYTINIEKIDEVVSILHFKVAEKNFETKFYFSQRDGFPKNEYLISPPYFYFSRWKKILSEHFIFYVSDLECFNQYSVNKLEDFINNIFTLLKFTEEEKDLLKKEKLIYILCKDEYEIEKLTGYKARGMGNLAYDYVITTYNCHYHELLHILINFKLKRLPLFTHPFFQEGIAVAFGGRGGYEPEIILNLGKFLEQSEFLNMNQLLNPDEYKTYDVSMSYPLSGLYNLFLIQEIGIENYLKLYIEYSSTNANNSVIDHSDLPEDVKWDNFVNNYSNNGEIRIDSKDQGFKILSQDSTLTLKENEKFYLFETKGNILITVDKTQENYRSKRFSEIYPDRNYNGDKYLIRVNDSEVAIYNLFTNNLIANYVSGFSIDMKPVPYKNGYYKFLIYRTIFDEEVNNWIMKTGIKND